MARLLARRSLVLTIGAVSLSARAGRAQLVGALTPPVLSFARTQTSRVVLEHVRVIDGTGAAAQPDRNVTIEAGKIIAIAAGADVPAAAGTTILDLRGYSVMPGIVGMHDHLWYQARPNLRADNSYDTPSVFAEMSFSAPRMYLASGVTTMRTAGSANPYRDVRLKQEIEGGTVPGPHLDVTGPYLEGASSSTSPPLYRLTGPDDARATVAYWAEHGVTSFKAYADITRDELGAAIAEAHRHGIKVTGHLCSVTYEEAVNLGIDNLEHGFFANTSMDPDKRPDTCSSSGGNASFDLTVPGSAVAQRLIAMLVDHHVALTSTMPLTAAGTLGIDSSISGLPQRALAVELMSPSARESFLYWHDRSLAARTASARKLRREMQLEREFVAAGGLLLAGPDPVGLGGVMPGFGDQWEIELLVDAGFSPVEAIRIATLNGATYMGRQNEIGSIAIGKNADLVVMKGDPSTRIGDIEHVEIVFKDGVGYDSKKLLDSVRGRYGDY